MLTFFVKSAVNVHIRPYRLHARQCSRGARHFSRCHM